MRTVAGLVIALGLVGVGPAAAQSDLSGLRGTARMPVTISIQGASLADALSMLADAAGIEIRLEPDAAATHPITARFNNARFGEVLSFLLERVRLKATVLDPKVVVVSAIPGQEPPSAVAATQTAPAIRLRFEIFKNQEPIARPMLALATGATGSVGIRNVARISVTPAPIDDERLAIAFEITSGAINVKPRLALRNQEPGTVSWTSESGSDVFELRVTRMR